MNKRIRGAAVVGGIAVLTLAGTGVALAGVMAQSATTQSVTSASWGLTPQALTTTDAPSLTWSTVDSLLTADKYFRLTNAGTETLKNATMIVTVARSNSSGQVQNLKFTACINGTWNTSNDTCSGTQKDLGTADGKNGMTVNLGPDKLPTVPGTSVGVRVTPTGAALSYTYTATITTTVTMAQTTGVATVTNS